MSLPQKQNFASKPIPTEKELIAVGETFIDILSPLHLDKITLEAAKILPLWQYNLVDKKKLKVIFKKDAGTILKILHHIDRYQTIDELSPSSYLRIPNQSQPVNIRKLVIALTSDLRSVPIKLMERIWAVKKSTTDRIKCRHIVRQILAVYAPLASHLGIGHLRDTLENTAFEIGHPLLCKKINTYIESKIKPSPNYIEEIKDETNKILEDHNIYSQINSRTKSLYSIWLKKKRLDVPLKNIVDIFALRIIVKDEKQCYQCKDVLHERWQPLEDLFDDYIKDPKDNGYQSLHTVIYGPGNIPVEFQIRTREMHEEAEYGICAHWKYKNTDDVDVVKEQSYSKLLEIMRDKFNWYDNFGWPSKWITTSEHKINEENIYTLTPNHHIIWLKKGATPIDFAYKIHTNIGKYCCAARVNGKKAPLNCVLEMGDRVEIFTDKEMPPDYWLNSELNYVYEKGTKKRIERDIKKRIKDKLKDSY